MKARVMWSNRGSFVERKTWRSDQPYLVVPLDPESLPALVEKVAKALDWEDGTGKGCEHAAEKTLHAIGVPIKHLPIHWAMSKARPDKQKTKKKA